MSLFRDIQKSLMNDEAHIGHILLKVRFLAAQLRNNLLEDWVRYEIEGYPVDVPVPEYRKISITYRGDFVGPFGAQANNVPLPSYLIKKFAGSAWVGHQERQSISALYELYQHTKSDRSGYLQIDSTNLPLVIQGKIYPELSCISTTGVVSSVQIFNILFLVRNKLLDLTIELEKNAPDIVNIEIDDFISRSKFESNVINNVVYQAISGNYQGSTAIGDSSASNIVIIKGNKDSLISELVRKGVPDKDAREFADIVEKDSIDGGEEPLSKRAQLWLADRARRIADGAWDVSLSVGTDLLKQAAKQYWGLP